MSLSTVQYHNVIPSDSTQAPQWPVFLSVLCCRFPCVPSTMSQAPFPTPGHRSRGFWYTTIDCFSRVRGSFTLVRDALSRPESHANAILPANPPNALTDNRNIGDGDSGWWCPALLGLLVQASCCRDLFGYPLTLSILRRCFLSLLRVPSQLDGTDI